MPNKYDYRQLREFINVNHDRFSELNFDSSMSLQQKMNALVEWFKVMMKEYNDFVDYLKDFQENFDEKLYDNVYDILEQWYTDDRFTQIFTELIETLRDYFVNVNNFGLFGDTGQDISIKLGEVMGIQKYLLIPDGEYLINNDLTIPTNVEIVMHPNAYFKVASGKTLNYKGNLYAGLTVKFRGEGIVSFEGGMLDYNIAWFEGSSLNKKFNFAKRGFKEFKEKIVRINRPYDGQEGVYKDAANRLFWFFDGPIEINDKDNAITFYNEGEWITTTSIEGFIIVRGPNKPENIYFYGTYQMLVPNSEQTVLYGIFVQEGARVIFYDQVVINGCRTSIKLGGDNQVGPATIYISQLQASFFREYGLDIHGNSAFATSCYIENPSFTSCLRENGEAVRIRGLIRNVQLAGMVSYSRESKDGFVAYDVDSVVLIQSLTGKTIQNVTIGDIFTTQANYGIRINSGTTASDLIRYIKVGKIYKKYDGDAFNINYCMNVEIAEILNGGGVSTFGSNTLYCKILNPNSARIDDFGQYNITKNIGTQNRGAGIPPAPAIDWEVGTIILEKTDSQLYLRVKKGGTQDDFIKLT